MTRPSSAGSLSASSGAGAAALGRLAGPLAALGGLPAHAVVVRAGDDADRHVDGGADLLLAEDGGPEAPALAVVGALLDLDPVSAVGTAGAPGWAALVGEVRDRLRAAKSHLGDPAGLAVAAGADEVLALAQVLQGAARRDTRVLLSGTSGVLAAALVAERQTPGTVAHLLAADTGTRPAGAAVLRALRLDPLLDLRLPGPGAAGLALGLLRAAAGLVDEEPGLVDGGPPPVDLVKDPDA